MWPARTKFDSAYRPSQVGGRRWPARPGTHSCSCGPASSGRLESCSSALRVSPTASEALAMPMATAVSSAPRAWARPNMRSASAIFVDGHQNIGRIQVVFGRRYIDCTRLWLQQSRAPPAVAPPQSCPSSANRRPRASRTCSRFSSELSMRPLVSLSSPHRDGPSSRSASAVTSNTL